VRRCDACVHDYSLAFSCNGRGVPTGALGEIVIRGMNVMKGYYRRPQEELRSELALSL